MLNLLKRFQWPLVVTALSAAVAYVVVLGFGEKLGIDSDVQAVVADVLSKIRDFAAIFLLPSLLADKNENGVLDVFEDEDIKIGGAD